MVKSLYSGVSGLKTHQAKMDVIGNNIANVNTTGFKAGVVTFRDVYYQYKINPSAGTDTLGGVNPAMVGYGVRLNSTTCNMTQSGYNQSDWWADIAMDGDGFFQVMDGAGNIFYTRAGKFTVDDQGYLVNASGYHVLGVTGDAEGVEPSSDIIRIVVPATNDHASSATKRINGTNVTLSVSAPSNNTDMSVTFTESDFPYATYNNGILNIFFNSNEQYSSQDDFEIAINTALQAGGVTLPDDVTLKFEFENIPDDYEAAAASNIVDNFRVSTKNASYQFHHAYTEAGITKHAYMTFSVNDPACNDTVRLSVTERPAGSANSKETATYTDGVWELAIFEDSTAAEINAAIKEAINVAEKNNKTISKLNCDNLVLPSDSTRGTVFKSMVDGQEVQLSGGTKTGVTVDLEVQEVGEFGNNYKVVFSYQAGYGKTNAAWDENTLNVTICADTTLADVNKAVKAASGGDDLKIIKFNEISGLDYGADFDFDRDVVDNGDGTFTITETDKNGIQRVMENAPESSPAVLTWTKWIVGTNTTLTTDPGFDAATAGAVTAVDNGDGTYTLTQTDGNGIQRICSNFTEETPADPNSVAWDSYFIPSGTEFTTDPGFESAKTPDNVWQTGFREAFFAGNPAVSPMDGKDSFFTETAKSLSTFALADGRIGSEQSYADLSDVVIQNDGTIIGLHNVHGYITLGRIDVATFDNPNGLAQAGGTNFAETVASGKAKLKVASTDGAGSILSGTLEMSNVDLSQEFTDMITTQRGFQANSRVITVSDTMLEELLNLKR